MRSRSFLILIVWGFIAVTTSAQPLRKAPPIPDSSGQNYYAVDSDDPVTDPLWKPAYKFLDTTYQPSTWHRIYPGALSVPSANPQGVFWRGTDSTDNTFAGPIPIGFPFNFYGVDYDSCYLSSNGFVGFGNFNRAMGADGPSFAMNPATGGNGCLPSTTLPKAIAAFLMTDGEMERTQFDSSRAFYRTNATNDSFFITFYNFYLKRSLTTGNTTGHVRGDVQIVFASKDSSITIHYRKFYGFVVIGLKAYTFENIFRNGCIPDPCTANAGVIGIQSDNQTNGTSYLCGGQFTSTGSVAEIHTGLAVKFRRWKNICKADSFLWPPRNFEMMTDDSLIPVATFRNVSAIPQSFYCVFRIRDVRTGKTVYKVRDSVTLLGSNQSQRLTFPAWRPNDSLTMQPGTMLAEAIASPFKNDSLFIGDYWPYDDTLKQVMFVLNRVENWSDNCNNFSGNNLLSSIIPDPLKWVNVNAAVVDGDVLTYSPAPPRLKQGDPTGLTLNSPVIKMDRLDATGSEYDHCAFGAINPSGNNTIGDGGTGDTIISFPINLGGKTNAVLGFSFERAGKKTYPRWYDLGTAVGPERTVTAPDTTQIFRAGDSLEIEYASPLQTTNVTSWKEFWAADGGKDFNFNRVYVPIDSSYCTNHFRFRVRLKAKNDFTEYSPRDDYDEWFLDNFVVTQQSQPEIEMEYVHTGPDWEYEMIPASQAVKIPLQFCIVNNGGTVGTTIGAAVIINMKGFVMQPGLYYGVYAKLVTIPVLPPHTSMVIKAPPWNSRYSGPGEYSVSAFVIPKYHDSESQNDSTYYDFSLRYDSSIVYDNGVNDAPGFFQIPGQGINLPETDPAFPIGGYTGEAGGGSLATKFVLYQRDTVPGVQLWFGTKNQAPDSMRISVFNSLGEVPGDSIVSICASFTTKRSGPWDSWSIYRFPCGPLVLDPGEYWMSISQLPIAGLELGAADYKSSVDWLVYDPSPNKNHVFVLNYPDMKNKFAYENKAGSNSWFPFYFPAGIGRPGYSWYDTNTAKIQLSKICGKEYNCFSGMGSWIPLIRPYLGWRTFGDTTCVKTGVPSINKSSLSFGTVLSCTSIDTTIIDSVVVTNDNYCDRHAVLGISWHVGGIDSTEFTTNGQASTGILQDYSRGIVLHCKPTGRGLRTAMLYIHNDLLTTTHTMDSIPLSVLVSDGALQIQSDTIDIGQVKVGTSKYVNVIIGSSGSIDDTIQSTSIAPNDPAIFISKVPGPVIRGNTVDSITVCFAAYDTTAKQAVVTIRSNPCHQVRLLTILGTGSNTSAVAATGEIPITVKLSPNRPNPFGDETTIDFDIAQSGRTRLIITDMLGRVCAVISDEHLAAGHYSKKFSAGMSLAGGMYVCVLESGGVVVRRMVDVTR